MAKPGENGWKQQKNMGVGVGGGKTGYDKMKHYLNLI